MVLLVAYASTVAWQVEIEDMDWNEELQSFTYQCPCGDLFQITVEELAAGKLDRLYNACCILSNRFDSSCCSVLRVKVL